MSPLLYFDPNNDDRNDHNSNRISQQRAVNTTLICNCRHCCGDVIQLFWNSWQPWNAQIPAFYWKDASCHQLKELISKPFTNILEIPLFPWNAAQLWFLLRILFTPLLLMSQSVLNHLCQKRLETGGCDSNNMTLNETSAGLWNNNRTELTSFKNSIVIGHHRALSSLLYLRQSVTRVTPGWPAG